MTKLGEDHKEFIEMLGNHSRLKILLTLWKSREEVGVYRVCRRTGLGRSAVRRHLNRLTENGVVSKRTYGAIALYSMNRENPRVEALLQFFRKASL